MNPFLTISDINNLTGYEFETLCRRFSSYAKLEGSAGLVRVLTRYKMFVDTTDISLVPHLVMDGFWETPVTQCLARVVKPGDVCVDVGAHLGYFSVLMSALAGETGKTLAVEPNPAIASMLKLTSGINHPGFRVWEGALGNMTGWMEIHIPRKRTGDSSLIIREGAEGEGIIHRETPVTTFDLLVSGQGLDKVDVVKIDAEGAEPLILDGMAETLARNPGIKIVMEFSPHLYSEVRRFNTFLTTRFDLYRISPGFDLEKAEASQLEEWSSLRSHLDLLLVAKGSAHPS